MSDHYCCKLCGLRYDACTCPPRSSTPAPALPHPSGVESINEQPSDGKWLLSEMGVNPDAWDANKPGQLTGQRLHDILDGGYIERYHVKGQRMLTRQSVADHSWRLAAIVFHINPNASSNLILGCLFHDVSERVTGDLPSPVKNAHPEVQRVFNQISTDEEHRLGIRFYLVEDEKRLLAWADRFEGALHCWDELQMGNRLVLRTLMRYIAYCRDKRFVLSNADMEDRRTKLFDNLDKNVQQYLQGDNR